jgi:RHS repeat-associated protein
VVGSYEYRRYQTGALPFWTPLRFPGQYYDAESDLFENWNRFYDSPSGRYLASEPIYESPPGFIGLSLRAFAAPIYGYSGNNPLGFIDPNGRSSYPPGIDPACGLTPDECKLHAKHLHDDWCACIKAGGTPKLKEESTARFGYNLKIAYRISGMTCTMNGCTRDDAEPTSSDYFDEEGGDRCQ